MQIDETAAGDVLVLALTGRLDADAAPALEARVDAATAADPRDIVVDFSNVLYVSSAGLRVLVMSAKHLRAVGRRLVLCGVDAMVYQVFEINGFSQILTFADTAEAALALLADPAGGPSVPTPPQPA